MSRRGMRAGLEPRLRQQTGLAPVQRQSLAVLRMPAATLHADILREAADNPYLRLRRPPGSGGALAVEALAATPGLLEQLVRQIGLMKLAPNVRAMACHLAGELRDDGYLDTTLEEIAADLGVAPALAEAGLAALQGCEPAGVGARDLPECLALQLVAGGLPRPRAAAAVAELEAFVARDWARLERVLALPRPELARIAALLPGLVAHPVPDTAPAVASGPDLLAEVTPGGAVSVRPWDGALPRVTLDPRLMATRPATPEAAEARARAQALVAGLAARATTLERIATHLLQSQRSFLAGGAEHLRPLSRREVADALGLHPSTVGRAVADKSVAIAGRVWPLSAFLSAPLPQGDRPALAGFAVRRRIARLIAEEPAGAPLSDEALRRALGAEGIDIARRTVAKYRDWMRLPSSHARRRIARLRAALQDGG